jgi:TrmH family RNA methyltransferase
MVMEPVRSHRNKIVVDAARLHRARVRSNRGQTLIEGRHLLDEALASGVRIETVFSLPADHRTASLAEKRGLRLTRVDQAALGRLAGTETPRGPVAIVAIPEAALDRKANLLVAWGLADPGNVGTMVRLAAAYEWGFAHTRGTADPWSPKSLRAGAGGQFQTGVSAIGGLEELEGWTTVATMVGGGVDVETVGEGPFALLIGEEASGLARDIVTGADHVVSITTPGPTESLNAASAASILVHELSKPEGHRKRQV